MVLNNKNYSVCIIDNNNVLSIRNIINILLPNNRDIEIIILEADLLSKNEGNLSPINKFHKVKLLFKQSTRSEGRNIAVRNAKNDIIVMTDSGCIPDDNWLKELIKPFNNPNIDISAGFYLMKANNNFQKAESAFLGVLPKEFNDNFLPSTRSVAFRKRIWKKIGGFPEELKDTAEDTIFFQRAIEAGAKIVRVKDAFVYWEMPKTIWEFSQKIYRYARGDAQSKIFWHPTKKWRTHNLKVLYIIIRYLFFTLLFFINSDLFLLIIFIYLLWAYFKVNKKIDDYIAALWGVPLQIISDMAASLGFLSGLLAGYQIKMK